MRTSVLQLPSQQLSAELNCAVQKSAKVNCWVSNSAKVSSVAIQLNRSVQTLKILCWMLQSAEHYNCESYNAKLCKTLQNSATLLCAKGCLELQSLFFVCMKSFKPWKSFLHHRKLFELFDHRNSYADHFHPHREHRSFYWNENFVGHIL